MSGARSPVGGRAAWAIFVVAFVIAAIAVSWRAQGRSTAPTRLRVVATVPPQAWLVKRLGGDRVDVDVLLPPGASEHTYEPTPQQVARLADARLVVEVGHPSLLFERRLLDAMLVREPQPLVVEMVPAGAASPAKPHDHGSDPHVWLSPRAMRAAAGDVEAALERLDPAGVPLYRANLRATVADVDRLDSDLRRELGRLRQRRFLVYHPAWGYFARDYGLQQVAIETDGKEPSPRRLVELVEEARRAGTRTVFVQRGEYARPAQAIAEELGAKVVALEPLAEDWPGTLRHTAAALREAAGG
ncbi:MAG TPA: zinc ABC transporter substrate-binding protein [Thermoanaerobaculia bacterium]|jgi:zinc transport system substrate-binding protein|nr:zinc ABC transporter substrate-binding protein [Thermoanaerobaculia bacterium]